MPNYRSSDAMREHMLDGNLLSMLEAAILFGVGNPNAEITRMKKATDWYTKLLRKHAWDLNSWLVTTQKRRGTSGI